MSRNFSVKIDKTKWDFRAIKQESVKIMARGQIKRELSQEVLRQVGLLKAAIVSGIKAHPVSREIEAGKQDPTADINYSGCCGGYGNLWAFIGFYEGDNPIKEATSAVLRYPSIASVRPYVDVVRISVNIPKKEDVFEVTSMPWAEGRSWAEGIAQGIAGFGRFLSTDDGKNNRSGGGLQIDHDKLSSGDLPRPNKFTRASYLGPIFSEALARFNSSIRQNFKLSRAT